MKEKYEHLNEGLSYYLTFPEVYHTNKLKEKIKKFFGESIKNKEKLNILDIGCNIGTDLFMLSMGHENNEYYGLDISKSALKKAKLFSKKRKQKIEFINHDANYNLPFKDESMDIILSSELIEHIKEPLKLLKEANRVLKKGGILILSTPNKDQLLYKILNILPFFNEKLTKSRDWYFERAGNKILTKEEWDEEGHCSLMTLDELCSNLKKAAFKICSIKGSSLIGGSNFFNKHHFLFGLSIIIDNLIQRFVNPGLNMCSIVKAVKGSS